MPVQFSIFNSILKENWEIVWAHFGNNNKGEGAIYGKWSQKGSLEERSPQMAFPCPELRLASLHLAASHWFPFKAVFRATFVPKNGISYGFPKDSLFGYNKSLQRHRFRWESLDTRKRETQRTPPKKAFQKRWEPLESLQGKDKDPFKKPFKKDRNPSKRPLTKR